MKVVDVADMPEGSLYSQNTTPKLPRGLCVWGERVTKLIDSDTVGGRVLMWEHSDLLKLKVAVEKALEVTPKPPHYTVFDSSQQPGCCGVYEIKRHPGSKYGPDLLGSFRQREDADEYVAWKNTQGELR